MLLVLLMLWMLLADASTPAGGHSQFRSVAAAMKVNQPGVRGDLSEEALQYIMDSTGVGWSANWTKFSRDPEVRADVSLDGEYCVACRGHFGEFGSGREVECCLIDSSSTVRWQRGIGEIWQRPLVSTEGHVAFFVAGAFNTSGSAYDLELLICDSVGDTVISENLGGYVSRVLGFEEVYDFSPDASLFFMTKHSFEKALGVPDREETIRSDNTMLYVYDLNGGKQYMHHLGVFRPREYEFVGAALEVRGTSGNVRVLGRGSRIDWTRKSRSEKR